jgi:class 3 adenylate cyclase/PAS domain-containing protein
MHYTAMGATYFYPVTGKATDHLALDQFWLSAGVTVITILIIIMAVVAVVIDQRLQSAAHHLRVNRQRMVEAIESISEGFALYDADDRLVLCNTTYRDLWGYSDTEAAPGVHWDDLDRFDDERSTVIDEGSGIAGSPWRAALSRRRQRQSTEIQFADGRWVTIRDRKTVTGDSVTIQTDITELKRTEEALAEKEAQLRVALDNMSGGMALGDRDLNYVLFNSQFSELFEFPDGLMKIGGSIRDELRYQADRGDFGPGDKDDLIERVVANYRRGEAVSVERAIAGSGRTLQVYLAPTPEGGYVTIATDITERKRAEAALVEAKRRSEEASKLIAEKNHMLESLSNQLSKYLSPQVYASIFSGEQSVEIASKRKKLTVFFSDIADFAGTTDSLESEELTNLLNHYLTEMSKIALDHGATIDKYVGDAIIAFFGDPETRGVKEDARACVNMAIAMQHRMRELQLEWLDMGLERPFEIRIGINTGFCTVGNFGSADRMDYTIIGNEVNLAARLETHAEVGGILMAHETHALVKGTVMAEEDNTLTVKGFTRPVRTYSVVGL